MLIHEEFNNAFMTSVIFLKNSSLYFQQNSDHVRKPGILTQHPIIRIGLFLKALTKEERMAYETSLKTNGTGKISWILQWKRRLRKLWKRLLKKIYLLLKFKKTGKQL